MSERGQSRKPKLILDPSNYKNYKRLPKCLLFLVRVGLHKQVDQDLQQVVNIIEVLITKSNKIAKQDKNEEKNEMGLNQRSVGEVWHMWHLWRQARTPLALSSIHIVTK